MALAKLVDSDMSKATASTTLRRAVWAAGVLLAAGASAQEAPAAHDYAALANADQWEFLDEYCTQCHNFEDYSGGLDFTTMSIDEVPADAEIWEKAVRKLRGRMMPPPG